jgi:Fe-S cluster assembly protein SufB
MSSTLMPDQLGAGDYKYGFFTEVDNEDFPFGLSEETIRLLSKVKQEPEYVLEFRLQAYHQWLKMAEPTWADVEYCPIDYQKLRYYNAPKSKKKDGPHSLEDVDQEILDTFARLGVPLHEQARLAGVAVDAVFDSVSVGTTHQAELAKHGVIFCSISEAVRDHPELVRKYMGSVVPARDNYFAALNSAVFTDGSFCYIPKGVRCPLDLSTYFRINAAQSGQFERTLIIADEGSYVNYLEGCTAPMRDENQLHAAIVELVALKDAEIRYSTVQNWYAGDKEGKGGIYNFVTKRGLCAGQGSKISWTQVEAGSAITWKYPSCILKGDHSVGEFYSVALTNGHMQADTGSKMIHLGKNTRSKIVAKGISAEKSRNSYRGQVKIAASAEGARNYSQCDSMLIGSECAANTYPYLEVQNASAIVEHEATTSKISSEQIFYLRSRGLTEEGAISLLLSGFCQEVFKQLPLEFSVEAVRLLEMKLENSIG